MSTSFRIELFPADVLEAVRAGGPDASGNPAVRLAAAGGEPLRCCLRDAVPGESLILFGHIPPIAATSPYREIGAVLTHAGACAGPANLTSYPTDWRGRQQVLRSYDSRGWITDGSRIHDGSDPEAEIAGILADRAVAQIHSRNAVWGCYMFTLVRG